MRKLLNNPLFVAALVLAALVFLGREVLFRPAPQPPPAPEQDEWIESENVPEERSAPGLRLGLPEALALLPIPKSVRDPFTVPAIAEAVPEVPAGPAPRLGRVRLSAIWMQGASVLVLLDGRVCGVGEHVGRCRVDAVDLDGAWLSHPGGRSRLAVGQELTFTDTP